MSADSSSARNAAPSDMALLVTVPASQAEILGALLMERLGPFELREAGHASTAPAGPEQQMVLVFYPPAGAVSSAQELAASLPEGLLTPEELEVELREVPRDWVEGWREHFRPLRVGRILVRPPWECGLGGQPGSNSAGTPAGDQGKGGIEVLINPGMGFGTGLHPTTRGTLRLLQGGDRHELSGPLVDAGTGSGVLAIAAAKLGFSPVIAFDYDEAALQSAAENVAANGVEGVVRLERVEVREVPRQWFVGATVLANLALEPACALLRRLSGAGGPERVVVSGILAGAQEAEVLRVAAAAGYRPRRRLYEAEWVTLEFLPQAGDPPNVDPSTREG